MTKTCDPKVYDLADLFLQDEPEAEQSYTNARIKALALHIQSAIENWIADNPHDAP